MGLYTSLFDGSEVHTLERWGPELRIMGGVDKMQLIAGREATRRYLESLVPYVEAGGYIPFCDHRCPPDVDPEAIPKLVGERGMMPAAADAERMKRARLVGFDARRQDARGGARGFGARHGALEHRHARALLGELEGARASHDAAAHDHRIEARAHPCGVAVGPSSTNRPTRAATAVRGESLGR